MQVFKDFFRENATVLCIAIGIAAGAIFSLLTLQSDPPMTQAPGVQMQRNGITQVGIDAPR